MRKWFFRSFLLMILFCCAYCAHAQEEMVLKGQLVEITDDVYHIEDDDGMILKLRFDFQSNFYLDRKEAHVSVLKDYILPLPVTVYYYYLDGEYFIDTLFASSKYGEVDFD